MRHLIAFALLASPAALAAQAAIVSPGMTHVQVVAALGEPVTSRTASEYTYLFYANRCGKECGMNDLVILHGDSVVDAIFRSPERQYSGTSSSPTEATPVLRSGKRSPARPKPAGDAEAKSESKPAATKPAETPATTTAPPSAPLRMAPSKPNDTRPSIPVNPPVIKPAAAPARKAIEVPGTKREIELPGTKREIEVPGTKTEAVPAPVPAPVPATEPTSTPTSTPTPTP